MGCRGEASLSGLGCPQMFLFPKRLGDYALVSLTDQQFYYKDGMRGNLAIWTLSGLGCYTTTAKPTGAFPVSIEEGVQNDH